MQRIHEAVYLEIEATATECFDIMLDFESYPLWQTAVKTAEVKERHAEGTIVEFTVDLIIKKIRYVLDYRIDRENLKLEWHYLEGDLPHIDGDFHIDKLDDESRCLAVYRLDITTNFHVPRPLVVLMKNTAMLGAMKDLRKRVIALKNESARV